MKQPGQLKRTAALAVVLLGLAGCGDPATFDAATTTRSLSSGGSTSAPTGASTSAPTPAPSTSSSAPVTEALNTAPDFTLALGDGGTFVLSEEARPVYLVFWAEW